ncbi:MAG: sigma-70 family RNA polymerase sigma factor [Bacteroidota bacterium]
MITQLKAGSQSAFKVLIDQYQKRVLNTCLGFLPNRHDAEDLTQEVFIEVYRSAANFRGDSSLSTWIYRIAVTKSLEQIRKRKRKKRMAFFQSLIGLDSPQVQASATDMDHPGIKLEQKERAQTLYKAIDNLSQNQRIAFTLHKIEGMSYKEISEIMDVSLSSIESLIFRARKNLQKNLYTFYQKQME